MRMTIFLNELIDKHYESTRQILKYTEKYL
jgi:hypothetical protein